MHTEYVIIVAGGKGLRMGGEIPKQFLPIGGVPVLMRTLMRFREYSPDLNIILVLPKAQQDYWRGLCQQHQYPLPSEGVGESAGMGAEGGSYQLADGGKTRFHSVQNGLALIPDDAEGVVGVHDGVRPFVSVEVIRSCYEAARTQKAVIPVTPVVETLRHIPTQKNVMRSDYCLVQTPQVFDIQLLKSANRQPYRDTFTDDASVVEAYGHPVTMVEGNRENIKITTPFDLKIAETLI
jgi:2-C-methyl-D-erythritol 4-phosphate cytidylyltransferase